MSRKGAGDAEYILGVWKEITGIALTSGQQKQFRAKKEIPKLAFYSVSRLRKAGQREFKRSGRRSLKLDAWLRELREDAKYAPRSSSPATLLRRSDYSGTGRFTGLPPPVGKPRKGPSTI